MDGKSTLKHQRKVDQTSSVDKEEPLKKKKCSTNLAQKTFRPNANFIKDANTDQTQRLTAGNNGKRLTSSRTHYSPTDPDAKISLKPGKACKLNYSSQMAVDSERQIISQIQAWLADIHDIQYLNWL